jgi:NADH-quinone oxidoreductase subunit M
MTALFFSVVGMIYDRAHTRDMDQLQGMMRVLPWAMVAFVVGGLVSMGMPGLSGFVAEFPIFLGVWDGGDLVLQDTAFGLNPSAYYPILAIFAATGIVITAAYILRAIGSVFLGEYDAHKWHDMRPILAIDKFTLVMFVGILIAIGVFPQIIAPIVESGVEPVVARLQEAQLAFGGNDVLQTTAFNLVRWFGGAG